MCGVCVRVHVCDPGLKNRWGGGWFHRKGICPVTVSWETSVQTDADLNPCAQLIGLGMNIHQFNIQYNEAMCVSVNLMIRTIGKKIVCK